MRLRSMRMHASLGTKRSRACSHWREGWVWEDESSRQGSHHVQMWDSGPLVLLASVTQTSFFMHVPGDGPLPCQGQSMCVTPAVKRNLRRWKRSANQACLPSGGGELMSREVRSVEHLFTGR